MPCNNSNNAEPEGKSRSEWLDKLEGEQNRRVTHGKRLPIMGFFAGFLRFPFFGLVVLACIITYIFAPSEHSSASFHSFRVGSRIRDLSYWSGKLWLISFPWELEFHQFMVQQDIWKCC